MAKLSRDKGKRGELEVVALLKKHGFEARRGQQFRGGSDSPDVIHNIEGIFIEVKLRQALNIYAALEQANEEKPEGDSVLLFHRKNNKRWLVTCDADEYLDLLEQAKRWNPWSGLKKESSNAE